MIAHLTGQVLFSDGKEVIIMTSSGVGHQVFCEKVFAEGSMISLFTSHVIRENSQELYGFETIRGKKLFELLLTVKNVGAKSAFALTSSLGIESIIDAVLGENKSVLKKAPGVGDKAASQMILDLSKKILKIRMYDNKRRSPAPVVAGKSLGSSSQIDWEEVETESSSLESISSDLMQETLLACKELGFKEEAIIPTAQKILSQTPIQKPEQLVHLVLKEL